MALFRLEVKTISRRSGTRAVGKTKGRGQSAVAAAAYRSGQNLYSERDQAVKRARTSGDIVHSEILAPEGAPDWARDRAALWNQVEAKETRKDARLAREVLVSLPRELSDDQRRELVRDFARSEFVGRGMVADVNIHQGRASDGSTNPHAHILLTVRGVSADGWDHYAAGGKDQPWNKTDRLKEWRGAWEEHCNRYLADAGSGERVDSRSLKDRGIEREPEPKLGPTVAAMQQRGVETDKARQQRLIRQKRADMLELERWARRQQRREEWQNQPKAANMDWVDSNRSVRLETAFNGQIPPEVRQRIEMMRQRVLEEREARNRMWDYKTTGQGAARYGGPSRPAGNNPPEVRRGR